MKCSLVFVPDSLPKKVMVKLGPSDYSTFFAITEEICDSVSKIHFPQYISLLSLKKFFS